MRQRNRVTKRTDRHLRRCEYFLRAASPGRPHRHSGAAPGASCVEPAAHVGAVPSAPVAPASHPVAYRRSATARGDPGGPVARPAQWMGHLALGSRHRGCRLRVSAALGMGSRVATADASGRAPRIRGGRRRRCGPGAARFARTGLRLLRALGIRLRSAAPAREPLHRDCIVARSRTSAQSGCGPFVGAAFLTSSRKLK